MQCHCLSLTYTTHSTAQLHNYHLNTSAAVFHSKVPYTLMQLPVPKSFREPGVCKHLQCRWNTGCCGVRPLQYHGCSAPSLEVPTVTAGAAELYWGASGCQLISTTLCFTASGCTYEIMKTILYADESEVIGNQCISLGEPPTAEAKLPTADRKALPLSAWSWTLYPQQRTARSVLTRSFTDTAQSDG